MDPDERGDRDALEEVVPFQAVGVMHVSGPQLFPFHISTSEHLTDSQVRGGVSHCREYKYYTTQL